MKGCNLADNGFYDLCALAYDTTVTIDATNNWWGMVDAHSIEDRVYHRSDNPNVVSVLYTPFASRPFVFDTETNVTNPDEPPLILPVSPTLAQNFPQPVQQRYFY